MCITLPTNPISRYLPKRNESMSQQRPMLITALFKIAPKWKQSKCVIGEWINKLWIYIKHNGTLLSNTKEWTNNIHNNMDESQKQAKCNNANTKECISRVSFIWIPAAAAAAKSLQSSLTLCDPTDGSPPGSPIPGILQARTLEWVAISFSKAWKWKAKMKLLSRVRLLATPWTSAYQAPPSMEFSRREYWEWVAIALSDKSLEKTNLIYNDRKQICSCPWLGVGHIAWAGGQRKISSRCVFSLIPFSLYFVYLL